MQKALTLVSVAGLLSIGGFARGQTIDTAAYHGGPVLSPTIECLMWAPSTGGFTSTDQTNIQDYLTGMQEYFANQTAPKASNGAGTEPIPRQYGVWGASFSGSCVVDHTQPVGPIDLGDHSANSVIAQEITTALGPNAYSQNTIVVVFTDVGSQPAGWAYGASFYDPQHWSIGSGKYIIGVAFDLLQGHYDWSSHELIEAATDSASGWWTDPQAAGCTQQTELCDDGTGTDGITLQWPLADGFGSSTHTTDIVTTVDNIDGLNNGDANSYPCPDLSGVTCTYIGNKNQCLSTLLDGFAYTATTTTPPVAVVQTGTKTNVIARTSQGTLVHMVSANNGASYVQVSPAPAGAVSEIPSVYSKDGTTIDMWGRGYDGALYHWVYNGSSWSAPTSLGGLLNGPPSAVFGPGAPGTQHDYAYVLGTDGNLYAWSSFWYPVAMPTNVWAISPPQVFTRTNDNTCADIFFTGSDGNVYLSACGGAWQIVPGSAGARGFGLLTATHSPNNTSRVDVFVKEPVGLGGSPTLWAQYQSGSLAHNNVLSALPNSVGQIGAVNFGSGANTAVWLFFTSNHNMYRAASDTTGTVYSGAAVIQTSPLVTSPITAFTPDNFHVFAYARRQSDGHLIQMSWVGTSAQGLLDLGVSIM